MDTTPRPASGRWEECHDQRGVANVPSRLVNSSLGAHPGVGLPGHGAVLLLLAGTALLSSVATGTWWGGAVLLQGHLGVLVCSVVFCLL